MTLNELHEEVYLINQKRDTKFFPDCYNSCGTSVLRET